MTANRSGVSTDGMWPASAMIWSLPLGSAATILIHSIRSAVFVRSGEYAGVEPLLVGRVVPDS